MKNFKFNFMLRALFIIPLLSMLLSCSDDDSSSTNGATVIESVSKYGYNEPSPQVYVPLDSLVTTGFSGNVYIIRGKGLAKTTAIYFNDFSAYFNPAMVTDTNIILTLPVGIPYSTDQTSNKIKIVTSDGHEVFYDFTIGAPAPSLTKYPLGGPAGTVSTITGTDFVNVISVKFGDIPAEIVSSTVTEIVVKIPEGITGACKIFVETAGGITESALTFGFNYVIYDDARNSDWWEGSWGGDVNYDQSEIVRDGARAVKKEYGGFGGFQIGNGGGPIEIGNYTRLKMSLYATSAGKANIVISGNAKEIDLVPGKWTDYEFSLQTDFNNPGAPGILLIQEFSGINNTLYIDNVGLL
jgi:hypothetical protein